MKNAVPMAILAAACGGLGHMQVRAQDLPGQQPPTAQAMPLAEALPTPQLIPTAQGVPTVQAEEIHGGGNWAEATDGMAAASVGQRWNIDALRFSDDRISGRIGISGSDLIDSANVDAQLSGRGVRGKLLDDDGKELAEFEGTVTQAGAFGTYRARTGDVGQWQWEGQPQPLQTQP